MQAGPAAQHRHAERFIAGADCQPADEQKLRGNGWDANVGAVGTYTRSVLVCEIADLTDLAGGRIDNRTLRFWR